jgi:hypothetical protein
MRKPRGNGDSLELLLDTVCSMFGAILLIAILVALMAQTTRDEDSGARAGEQILQRKISTTEADLAETRRLLAQTATPSTTSATALAAEKRELLAAIAEARAENDQLQAQLQDHISRQTVDYGAAWKKLIRDQRSLEEQQKALAAEIRAQEEKTARLNSRADDLAHAIKTEKESRVVNLRLPKEHANAKRILPIICRYGRLYPLMDAQGKRNETTLVWSQKGSGSVARPVEALGWALPENKSALEDLFNGVHKSEYYIGFFVYPDSTEAFHTARELATAAQLDFGLELDRPGTDLNWGADGTTPPAL